MSLLGSGTRALQNLRTHELLLTHSRTLGGTLALAEVPKAGGSLVSLGAGSGSKAAAMYLAKYALKQSAEISASCAVLIDAQAHIKEFASVAEDAEVPEQAAPW